MQFDCNDRNFATQYSRYTGTTRPIHSPRIKNISTADDQCAQETQRRMPAAATVTVVLMLMVAGIPTLGGVRHGSERLAGRGEQTRPDTTAIQACKTRKWKSTKIVAMFHCIIVVTLGDGLSFQASRHFEAVVVQRAFCTHHLPLSGELQILCMPLAGQLMSFCCCLVHVVRV